MFLELGRRIDYIMVRCGVHGPTLQVTDCFLAFDEPPDGVRADGHRGRSGKGVPVAAGASPARAIVRA